MIQNVDLVWQSKSLWSIAVLLIKPVKCTLDNSKYTGYNIWHSKDWAALLYQKSWNWKKTSDIKFSVPFLQKKKPRKLMTKKLVTKKISSKWEFKISVSNGRKRKCTCHWSPPWLMYRPRQIRLCWCSRSLANYQVSVI